MRLSFSTFISTTFLGSGNYKSQNGSKDSSGVETSKFFASRAIKNRKNYSDLGHGTIVMQHDYSVDYVDDNSSETRLRTGQERTGEWHEMQPGASLAK